MIAECGDRPGAVEDYPFGDDVAVFKVVGTMFALVPLLGQPPGSISLKCDPDLAVGLRARYLAITAGYHLNKRHSARGTRRTPRSPRSHRPPRRSPD
ncbi:MAG TPA: MmcQ/YjbR family DNA-binding protein [Pseudonocardiaceae bacterium]|nr:MmcQ/YjbR family DNA-binding protein [Pseudonocardiaceae bacterium]